MSSVLPRSCPGSYPHSPLSSPQVCSWAGTGGCSIAFTGIEGVVPAVLRPGPLCARAPQACPPEPAPCCGVRGQTGTLPLGQEPPHTLPGAVRWDKRFCSVAQRPCAHSQGLRITQSSPQAQNQRMCAWREICFRNRLGELRSRSADRGLGRAGLAALL